MEERRRAILREVKEKGKVRVAELSKELDCSEAVSYTHLIVRTSHDTLFINSKINCTKWIFMILSILGFLFKHWKLHILFNSVLFTKNIVVK